MSESDRCELCGQPRHEHRNKGNRPWHYYVPPFKRCHEEVTDANGYLTSCDRIAVGTKVDSDFPELPPYPVCRTHLMEPGRTTDGRL